MRSNLRVPVSCSLSLMLFTANARAAAPAVDHEVAVEIDTSKLSAAIADKTRERLALEVDAALEEAGMRRGTGGRALLRIEITPVGDSKVNFAYRASCLADGRALDDARFSGTCDRCVADQVIGKVDAGLPAALASLRGTLEREPAATPPPRVDTAGGGAASPSHDSLTDAERARVTPLTWAGIGVGLGGLAIGALGTWLALRPTKYRDLSDTELQGGRDTRRPGIGVASVGGAVFIAGVAMAIAGAVGPRKQRRAAVGASPSRTGGVVTFGMRF
jgi:hypothetical protein